MEPGSYTFGRGRGRIGGDGGRGREEERQQEHREPEQELMSGRAAVGLSEAREGERAILARRPDEGGSLGTPKKVKVNFFPVNVAPEAVIHLYQLIIAPCRWTEFMPDAREGKAPAPLTPLEKHEIFHFLTEQGFKQTDGFIHLNNAVEGMVFDGNGTLMTVNAIPGVDEPVKAWSGPQSGHPIPAYNFGHVPPEAANLDEDTVGREVSLHRFTYQLKNQFRPAKYRASLRPIFNPASDVTDPKKRSNSFKLDALDRPHEPVAKADYRVTPAILLDAIFSQWCQSEWSPQATAWYGRKPSMALCNPYSPDNDPQFKIPLPNGVEVWYGLFFASRIGRINGVNRPFVNLDTAVGVMYTEQTFMEFAAQLLGGLPPGASYPERFTGSQAVTINRFAAGIKVRSLHIPRTYVVKAFRNDYSARSTRFAGPDGVEISVEDYFLAKYKTKLRFPEMGMVEVKTAREKQTTWLPVEVLEILKKQEAKNLPDSAASIMIKKLCTPAPEREARVMKLAEMARFGTDPWAGNFGLGIVPNMHQPISRILPTPSLAYGGRPTVPRIKEGVWENQTLYEPKPLEEQTVLIFAFSQIHRDIGRIAEEAWKNLQAAGKKLGMILSANIYNFNANLSLDHDTIVKQICGTVSEAREAGKKINQIMVIFKERSPQLYNSIKYVGDHFLGITSQCVLLKTISPLKPQTAANILLKMNVKLGGANWRIAWDKAPKKILDFVKEPTLILGADVSHPKPGDSKLPSIASVVGNTDRELAHWNATIAVKKESELEDVPFFRYALEKRIFEYVKRTKKVPKHLILYRDGVSESQYQALMAKELAEVRAAINNLFGERPPEEQPRLTFVVTIKRHHVRLFPATRADAIGRAQNVAPGTCVDSEVASPDEWDFWLMSHAGLQGTCRPTYYQILYDENGMTSDSLQLLSYFLCHNYARCTRAVSYPQPVYYAALAAERARGHLAAEHASLEDSRVESSSSSGPTDSRSSRAPAGSGSRGYAPSASGHSDAPSSNVGRSSSSSTSSSSSSSSAVEETGVKTPDDAYRNVSAPLQRLQIAATVSPAFQRGDNLYFM